MQEKYPRCLCDIMDVGMSFVGGLFWKGFCFKISVGEVEYMLKCVTFNGSHRRRGEMLMV